MTGVCVAPPGRKTACGHCGAAPGQPCPRKTATEKMIESTGGMAKIGLARGALAK